MMRPNKKRKNTSMLKIDVSKTSHYKVK